MVFSTLSSPLSDFPENGKLQTYISGHHAVPYISQNDWGRTVELLEVIKAGFTPFWFELWPVRIQHKETPLAYFTRTQLHVVGCCGKLCLHLLLCHYCAPAAVGIT
jgi:hypothetical protein